MRPENFLYENCFMLMGPVLEMVMDLVPTTETLKVLSIIESKLAMFWPTAEE